jgi:hypothetical protein
MKNANAKLENSSQNCQLAWDADKWKMCVNECQNLYKTTPFWAGVFALIEW